jgi:hypothetical protein
MQRILVERGVGLDLDNTIVDYGDAFAYAAVELGVAAPAGGKTALRDAVRAQPGGEQRWREIQAYAYGPGMGRARAFPGVEEFFRHARWRGVALRVISHKTPAAAARSDIDLRAAARAWLARQPFAQDVPVVFAATREEKLAEIAAAGVALFIDDLVEVLGDPRFPRAVDRWLFAPDGAPASDGADRVFRSWDEMTNAAFGG